MSELLETYPCKDHTQDETNLGKGKTRAGNLERVCAELRAKN
jgi:hypothetical protein